MFFMNKKKKLDPKRVISSNKPMDFETTEAYKSIRTNLQFAVQKKGCKIIAITSAQPDEGKSTSCSRLGIVIAQTGAKVLMIDCDLRKPSIHKLFQQKSIPGLSDILGGMSDLETAIQETKFKHLNIIFAGTVPPNPAELLGSEEMKNLLDTVSESFDYILLDTPPINIVADALALTPIIDGVVVVVKQGETKHPELMHVLSSLEFAKSKVLGIILYGVERKNNFRYSKYKYKNYYGKDYGYFQKVGSDD